MRIKGFTLIFNVKMEESMKKGCSQTETLGMRMLVSIPERDGAVGLQQLSPFPLRRTCIWEGSFYLLCNMINFNVI